MIYTLSEIKQKVAPLIKKYHIPAFYLFGSYARGTARDDSDLDFIVDTTGTGLKSLLSLGALYNDLEDVFQKRIDLITLTSLTQKAQMPSETNFKNTVWKERVSLHDVV